MARCVVLLRGVNVGGHNRIAMDDLRSLLADVGCSDVVTYLQSGNAVVSWPGTSEALGSAAEAALRSVLDLPVPVLVREGAELAAAVSSCPFPEEDRDPKLLHAVFLSGSYDDGLPEVAPDRVAVGDRLLYVRYAASSQDSPAARWLTSKRFPLVATARNWRTVLALRDLATG